MEPIFDLAMDLSQAYAFLLPFQTPHMPAISVRQSRGKSSGKILHMSDIERPIEERKIMNTFPVKFFQKSPSLAT